MIILRHWYSQSWVINMKRQRYTYCAQWLSVLNVNVCFMLNIIPVCNWFGSCLCETKAMKHVISHVEGQLQRIFCLLVFP